MNLDEFKKAINCLNEFINNFDFSQLRSQDLSMYNSPGAKMAPKSVSEDFFAGIRSMYRGDKQYLKELCDFTKSRPIARRRLKASLKNLLERLNAAEVQYYCNKGETTESAELYRVQSLSDLPSRFQFVFIGFNNEAPQSWDYPNFIRDIKMLIGAAEAQNTRVHAPVVPVARRLSFPRTEKRRIDFADLSDKRIKSQDNNEAEDFNSQLPMPTVDLGRI